MSPHKCIHAYTAHSHTLSPSHRSEGGFPLAQWSPEPEASTRSSYTVVAPLQSHGTRSAPAPPSTFLRAQRPGSSSRLRRFYQPDKGARWTSGKDWKPELRLPGKGSLTPDSAVPGRKGYSARMLPGTNQRMKKLAFWCLRVPFLAQKDLPVWAENVAKSSQV